MGIHAMSRNVNDVWANSGTIVGSVLIGTTKPGTDSQKLDKPETAVRIFARMGAGASYRQILGNPRWVRVDNGQLILLLDSGTCGGFFFDVAGSDGKLRQIADCHQDRSAGESRAWLNAFQGVGNVVPVADTDAASY